MKTADFDYQLPKEQIAQVPLEERDGSRLMVLNRQKGTVKHRIFRDILEYFQKDDVIIFNSSRVIPARLKGEKEGSGGKVEILLLKHKSSGLWQALVKPSKRLKEGHNIILYGYENSVVKDSTKQTIAQIISKQEDGICLVRFNDESALWQIGAMPLPPYITAPLQNPERYQTVYAKEEGSVAAPTAGLHFTEHMLEKLRHKGVQTVFIKLHISLDTFRPVKVDDPTKHPIHQEYYEISAESAEVINNAKENGNSIFCVGTSAARAVEQCALLSPDGKLYKTTGQASLLILPGHKWLVVDKLITNFHLPKSTLLMLVSSFYDRNKILQAYKEAVRSGYRFFSFGDCMLLL
ncbi:MAG: tRNA preQ1(34) S-adenosylmethionine ribosyltransferase-isomerase QueA [Chloroflexi bacterium]|nr:tRNA preQ1(34) S-adenosylmethionine ribosyltransferase-isomerase QueA [Chloroflexota bacterium]